MGSCGRHLCFHLSPPLHLSQFVYHLVDGGCWPLSLCLPIVFDRTTPLLFVSWEGDLSTVSLLVSLLLLCSWCAGLEHLVSQPMASTKNRSLSCTWNGYKLSNFNIVYAGAAAILPGAIYEGSSEDFEALKLDNLTCLISTYNNLHYNTVIHYICINCNVPRSVTKQMNIKRKFKQVPSSNLFFNKPFFLLKSLGLLHFDLVPKEHRAKL